MSLSHQDTPSGVTEHALLVAYGRFAQQVGLIRAVEQVPFEMKTIAHSPADKVIELTCHVLAGGMHVNELAKSAHPLLKDQAVAEAWGQESFASSSGVSQLLHSVSAPAVETLKSALRQIVEPYRRRMLGELSPSWLVVDFDLTGLVVSDQAICYEGADFGHVGGGRGDSAVSRGYRFARAQVVGRRDVFVLGGFLHSGHTVEKHCLAQLVALTEAQLGRPRRRIEHIEALLAETERGLATIEAELARLIEEGKAPCRRERLKTQSAQKRLEIVALQVRRDEMAAENAANLSSRRIILRLDGGFGNACEVAWLYEQGYSVVTRAHAHRVAMGLRKEEGLSWEKVGKNLFIAEAQRHQFGECPYPMRLFLCKQWWGEDHPERFSALVVTPDLDQKAWPVRRVGVFYNERQIIEAGIKESKGILASRHLPTRHQAGIALYQELVLFAQNFIRWFRRQFLARSVLAAASVKELVRIGANSRAQIIQNHEVTLLRFASDSPWGGLTVPLKSEFSYQLGLPFPDHSLLAGASP